MSLLERLQRYLNELRLQGRIRQLKFPTGIDFSSNDYLGYGKKSACVQGKLAPHLPVSPSPPLSLSRSGQASRLLRGQHELWEEVEARLARWHGAESALMMTSGYTANEGLLSSLLQPEDFLASDQCNHASIIDGARLAKAERFIFRHNDLNHLEEGLRRAAQTRMPGRELFVITEALFGMEADRAPLRRITSLAQQLPGPRHRGRGPQHRLFRPGRRRPGRRARPARRSPGDGAHRRQGSWSLRGLHLLFTAAARGADQSLPASDLHAPPCRPPWPNGGWRCWRAFQPIIRPADLCMKLPLFSGPSLNARGSCRRASDYIVPVLIGDDGRAMRVAAALCSAGFDIRAIRPPTVPEGTARLRISIHADHTREQLQSAARAVSELAR